jgi:hypothetical protein
MNTDEPCTHEDCDCRFCDRCGKPAPEGTGQRMTYSLPDGDTDSEVWCDACVEERRKDQENNLHAYILGGQMTDPYRDSEDYIPF